MSQVRTRPHGFGDLPPASHAPHGDDKRRSRDGENLERDRGFEAASLQQRVTLPVDGRGVAHSAIRSTFEAIDVAYVSCLRSSIRAPRQ